MLFLISPILVGEVIFTLRSTRFLITTLRAMGANHAKLRGLRSLESDQVMLKRQEAYAYTETIAEVLLLEMIALCGVCYVQYTMEVHLGKSYFSREFAVIATLHLIGHVLLSFTAWLFPEFITRVLIRSASFPPDVESLLSLLILVVDISAHVLSCAFLASALMNKVSASILFVIAAGLYRVFDQGTLNLAMQLKRQVEQAAEQDVASERREKSD